MGRRKTYTEARTVLYVRVDKEIRAELNKRAAAENRTLNNYMETLLLKHLYSTKKRQGAQAA
jgi:predicted HicB family RNase H-like nuclease